MTTNHGGIPDDAELMAATSDLAAALRELVEASVRTTTGAAQVRGAAELVRAATARISGSRRPLTRLPALDDPATGRRVFNPVIGVGSAIASPLRERADGDGVVAEGSFNAAYEGPPTFLHGGMSALVMDQLLGDAAWTVAAGGMTVHLELDYRRPVPLETPLVMRAGVTEATERKTVTAGTIALASAPHEPCVRAGAVFVRPRPEQAQDYFGTLTDASGRRPTGAADAAFARD